MAVINTNVQSLTAQRNLGTSQTQLSTSMQRLSSGLRINSAKDDAAGLAIAERMSAQVRGLNQAARNANDGVSLAQTAEGALGTIGNNLQRIRELAVQSRNATNSTEDRAALQKEVAQLRDEIGRVAKDTSFNGTNLLDGSFTSKAFQVGANQGQIIEIDSIVNAKTSELGSWTSVNTPATLTGIAPTTTGGGTTPGTGSLDLSSIDVTSGDYATFNLDVNGTTVTIAASSSGTENANSLAEAVATAINGTNISGVTADGTTNPGTVAIANTGATGFNVTIGATDIGAVTAATTTAGSFAAITDLQINGEAIAVGTATSASQRTNDLLKAINSNTNLKAAGVTASLENGNLKLASANAALVIGGGDAAAAGLTGTPTAFVASSAQLGFSGVDVSTTQGSDNAILAMDAALTAVNSARADLGAIQNRFEAVVSNLAVNSENLSASRSRIMDADFAQETANLSRSQILQQAGTAMVAQANQLPQNVLKLLQ
jgi:flagellin